MSAEPAMFEGPSDFEGPSADGIAADPAHAHASNPSDGLAILVAEDNEINALLANALLQRLGHRPTIVATGDAAVAAWLAGEASGGRLDLVLLDVHMPARAGISATPPVPGPPTHNHPPPTPNHFSSP